MCIKKVYKRNDVVENIFLLDLRNGQEETKNHRVKTLFVKKIYHLIDNRMSIKD